MRIFIYIAIGYIVLAVYINWQSTLFIFNVLGDMKWVKVISNCKAVSYIESTLSYQCL